MPPPSAPLGKEPTNIVLICVDQWRGDCLGGHPVVETPYLNQLASQGTRLARAYAACPSCIAARASLFTGLTPASHGRVGYKDRVAWNYPVTLAGEFTRGGYQTQAVGKMHVYPNRSRVGFENVVLHDGFSFRDRQRDSRALDDYLPWLRQRSTSEADFTQHGLTANAYTVRPWDQAEALHPTNFVSSQSIDFLYRRDPTKPFFLYMSFHRPHTPLDPPAWALEQYLDVEMPPAIVGDWAGVFEPFRNDSAPDASVAHFSEGVRRRALAGYYGHLTHIDHQINRFIEALREFGLRKNTLIVFVSDHGDLMGDHHLWRKTLPYEGSARVPLFFHGPDAGIQSGKVLDLPVELRDLMPTLLEIAGLPVPKTVEGQSFAAALRGERHAEFRPFIHGEHTCFGNSAHYLTDGREKYVWLGWNGAEQLFDLESDPKELRDLSGEKPKRLNHWRQILVEELRGRPEGTVRDGKLVAGRPVSPVLPHVGGGVLYSETS